jgi:hypothetical protein
MLWFYAPPLWVTFEWIRLYQLEETQSHSSSAKKWTTFLCHGIKDTLNGAFCEKDHILLFKGIQIMTKIEVHHVQLLELVWKPIYTLITRQENVLVNIPKLSLLLDLMWQIAYPQQARQLQLSGSRVYFFQHLYILPDFFENEPINN